MSFDAAFNQVDVNGGHSGFSQWSSGSSNAVGGEWSSAGGAGAGAIFDQVDVNRDGNIDRSEFNQWASSGFGGAAGAGGFGGAGSAGGFVSGGSASSASRADIAAAMARCNVPQYATDANGYFRDPNPRIETRAGTGEAPTYQQNIRIRFHQPPPLPPPPPNRVIERRPPPPPPPPPHRIREPVRPSPPQPPLIIRERPPQMPPMPPPTERVEVVPGFPAPPRSVITERFAPLPPRPRDVIMERWVPYGPRPPGRTIRVPAPCGPLPPAPRNLVIQYSALQARVVRQFQRLGVTVTDPQTYLQQHGASLLDSATFVQQARSAGVVEDISPPAASASASFSAGADLVSGGAVSGGEFGFASSGASYGGFASSEGGSYEGAASSEHIGGGAGFEVAGGSFSSGEMTHDAGLGGAEFSSFAEHGL